MSVLALEHLFLAVTASFAADHIQASNLFGWCIPTQHPYGPRIAWVPGDPSDNVGLITSPKYPSTVPRQLGTLIELFTVYFTAQDPSDPENEMKQYHIVRELHDAWFRAAYFAAHGTFTVRSENWITKHTERRHGATLRLVCELQAPILDVLPDSPLVDPEQDSELVDARQEALDADTTLGANVPVLLNETPDDVGVVIVPGELPPSEDET